MITLSPSILSADFSDLARDIKEVTDAGAQMVHVDVMDGHFVPNISIGACVVKSIRKKTDAILDVHLMIENPERYAEDFLKAGADIIGVHHEACNDFNFIADLVKKYHKKICITINPETPASVLEAYKGKVDMILIMSVHPGFGGQSFIADSLDKIRFARSLFPDTDIEVDGGVKLDNARAVLDAGANVLVAGSAVFGVDNVQQRVHSFLNL